MLSWFEAAVLGVVQGLTEFLPISSSAHLRVVAELAGWEDPGAAFTAVTQLGTESAVLVYFRHDIVRIVTMWTRSLWRPELRGEPDAPPQRLGGRGSGEPGGQEACAEGVPRPGGVDHPRRRRGHSLPFSVRVGVQSTPGAELVDDAGVV